MLVEDAKENNLKEEEEKNEIIIPERLNTRVKLTNKIYKSDSSDEEDEEVKEGPLMILSNRMVNPEQAISPSAGLTKVENLSSVKLKYGSRKSSKQSEKLNEEEKKDDSHASQSQRNNWVQNKDEDEVIISNPSQQNNRWND